MKDDRLERMANDLANATEPRISVEQAAEVLSRGLVSKWPVDTTQVRPRYIHERPPKQRWWRRIGRKGRVP